MLLQLLNIVAPVFLLSAFGWGWVRRGLPYDIAFVTRLAMQVSCPCLIFATMAKVEIAPAAFTALALASFVLYLVITVLSAPVLHLMGMSQRAFLPPLVFGNTGNMGLPLALFAFGEAGLAYAMVVFAIMAVLSFTIGVWMASGQASPREALRQPIFYAAALGCVATYTGWDPPVWAANTLQLTGQMAIPMMLITLGVSIARLSVADLGRALGLSVIKLIICALAGVLVAQWFGLTGALAGAFVLQAITPVAVTNYLIAQRYNAEPEAVAGLVVVSTLLSVASIPLALAWYV